MDGIGNDMSGTGAPGGLRQQGADQVSEIASRIRMATADMERLTFEEVLARAPRVLQSLIDGARLRIVQEHERPADADLRRGPVEHTGSRIVYEDFYLGPPEPVWFTAYGFPADDLTCLAVSLFFERLQRALQLTGYSEELSRQARRDWLTGLQWGARLEETLHALDPAGPAVALAVLQLPSDRPGLQDAQHQLRRRWFAHSLRLALTEEDEAFQLQQEIIAVLTPERELSRLEAAITRLAPQARLAYALSGEARGPGMIELALTRLTGRSALGIRPGPATAAVRQQKPAVARVGIHPPVIHCGTSTARALVEQVTGEWRFPSPVNLILDLPVGYAFEALDFASRPVLIVTDGASSGYLHDLTERDPDGLVVGSISTTDLRNQLGRVSEGERVYSGPIMEKSPLFPREREVWRLIAQGLDNPEIAERLGIGQRTVANYFTSLRDKLHVASRSAVALAYWGRLSKEQAP